MGQLSGLQGIIFYMFALQFIMFAFFVIFFFDSNQFEYTFSKKYNKK